MVTFPFDQARCDGCGKLTDDCRCMPTFWDHIRVIRRYWPMRIQVWLNRRKR